MNLMTDEINMNKTSLVETYESKMLDIPQHHFGIFFSSGDSLIDIFLASWNRLKNKIRN